MSDLDILSLIINFGVATGTLLLALYAYNNIKITQSQLKSFQEQTKILLSQNQPILRFESYSFKRNVLNIQIKNLGTQPAFDIGFSTICLRAEKVHDISEMKWLHDFKWPHITKDYVKDFFEISKNQLLQITDYDPKNVLAGEKKFNFRPESGFTYLKRDNGESIISPSDGTMSFECEPLFCLDNDFQNLKKIFLEDKIPEALQLYSHQRKNFDEIREICQQNKIRYVFLKFSLYCKDLIENEIFQNEIVSGIVDLEEDNSIEDALSKPRILTHYPMSHQKLVKDIGFEPMWMYTNSKYKTHYLTEIEKEEMKNINKGKKRGELHFSRKD